MELFLSTAREGWGKGKRGRKVERDSKIERGKVLWDS